jgi:steroid delta-isomerase-like uncharacterized protein
MRRFWHSKRQPEQRIDEMVELASKGKLSRRRLVASLTAVGVSASAAATFVAAAEWLKSHEHATQAPSSPREQQNLQRHDQHLSAQKQGSNLTPNAAPSTDALSDPALRERLDAMLHDYHPDALVEDMLSRAPIQGHEAIRAHKAQEFLSFSSLDFRITRRSAVGDQVVAEWVASGTLNGEFKGLIGNGESFEIPGVTVVSRNAEGKIVKESIYYDLTHVQRYLRFKPTAE